MYIYIDKSENRVAVLLTLSVETAHDNALARKWVMPIQDAALPWLG